jgi:hypothetical protein
MTDREAFEQSQAKMFCAEEAGWYKRDPDGRYFNNQMETDWQTWQAALAYAREQASLGQWIPVAERLPEDRVDVLIIIKCEEQPTMAHYNVLHKSWFESVEHSQVSGDAWLDNEISASEVTHWMPLPAAPLPQSKEGE